MAAVGPSASGPVRRPPEPVESASHLGVSRFLIREPGRAFRHTVDEDHMPATFGELREPDQRFGGHEADRGDDDRGVSARPRPEPATLDPGQRGERVVVHEIEVEAGRPQAEQEVGAELPLELDVHVEAARALPGEDVGQRQVDGDGVHGHALAQERLRSPDVAGELRVVAPPGVRVVDLGGGVEGPARLSGHRRRVRVAVVDQVVQAVEERGVRGRLHLLERRHEERSAQPGVGLAGDEGPAVEVGGRGGEPAVAQVHHVAVAQEDVLAFRDGGQAVSLHDVAERAVGLDTGLHPAPLAPLDEGTEESVQHQVGEREVEVVADVGRFGSGLLPQGRKPRAEVVAPSRAKLLEEVGRPVGAVDLEAVAEDRVEERRALGFEGVHHPVAAGAQEQVHRLAAEVIDHGTFHADRRAASPAGRWGRRSARRGATRLRAPPT